MTFISAVVVTLFALFGAAIVVAAFNVKKLIAWENRVLTSLADKVHDYRLDLEEEAQLLERTAAKPAPAPPRAAAKTTAHRSGRAA